MWRFSDALTAVRAWLWEHWVFPQAGGGAAVQKTSPAAPTIPAHRTRPGGLKHEVLRRSSFELSE